MGAFAGTAMSIRPPPRFVVRPADAPPARPRRRLWLVAAWLGSLALTGLAVHLATERGPLASPDRSREHRLVDENADLKQQVAILKRSEQVANVAAKDLQGALADREEQISGLRADLAFYAHLVGGGAQREGLQVQGVHLKRVAGSNAWNITVTLTQNARRGGEVKGRARIALEGVRGDKLARLDWSDLAGPGQQDGLDFDFKYFQQLHGTVMLPDGFTPNRLRVTATPQGGATITQSVSWSDALKNPEDSDVEP